jgi:hypothetical protein
MSHTILLVQPTRKLEARSYGDFESLNEVKKYFLDFLRNVKLTKSTGPGGIVPHLRGAAEARESAPADNYVRHFAIV